MIKKLLLSLFTTFMLLVSIYAQEGKNIEYNVVYTKVEGNDTILYVHLAPVTVYFPKFKKRKDYRKHYKLVYNLNKVYPYSVIVKEKMGELNKQYLSFKDKKERKAFLKNLEKELFSEFEAPLRKLSRSQGKVLMKLIDRETGQTSFQLIKEFKGGFLAGFWQTTARIFGNNLKTAYDKNGEDAILEELVLMCEDGSFEYLYQSMFGYLKNM